MDYKSNWTSKDNVDQSKADAMQRAFKKKAIDLGSGFESLKKVFTSDEEDKKKKLKDESQVND